MTSVVRPDNRAIMADIIGFIADRGIQQQQRIIDPPPPAPIEPRPVPDVLSIGIGVPSTVGS